MNLDKILSHQETLTNYCDQIHHPAYYVYTGDFL